jgi:hypothetical protein
VPRRGASTEVEADSSGSARPRLVAPRFTDAAA